jgi:LmbE family N-acetylglucosaminyl deacetylase
MYCKFESLRSVVCIGAHADDIEIGCGGTLLQMRESFPGLQVDWVVLAGDEKRRAEAAASFKHWTSGSSNCRLHQFDFPDTQFPWNGVAIKQAIHGIAESLNPDAVFTHYKNDAHQDHRLVSELTWNAFRNHLILEYEIPKFEGDLAHPNVYFPLSTTMAERKVELLMNSFESQRDKPWFDERTFFAILRLRGIESKAPDGWAEAFHGRKIWMIT